VLGGAQFILQGGVGPCNFLKSVFKQESMEFLMPKKMIFCIEKLIKNIEFCMTKILNFA
jgi:hypothetical protein